MWSKVAQLGASVAADVVSDQVSKAINGQVGRAAAAVTPKTPAAPDALASLARRPAGGSEGPSRSGAQAAPAPRRAAPPAPAAQAAQVVGGAAKQVAKGAAVSRGIAKVIRLIPHPAAKLASAAIQLTGHAVSKAATASPAPPADGAARPPQG